MDVLKRYYKKTYFDDDEVNRGVYDYHTLVGMALAGNGIIFNQKYRSSWYRLILPFVCVGLALVGIAFMGLGIYHSIELMDIPEASESFTYLIIVITVTIQNTNLLLGQQKMYIMMDLMEEHFKIIENATFHDASYRNIFYSRQLLIKRMTLAWAIFITTASMSFIGKFFLEILYQQLIEDRTAETVNPFLFNLWLPYDDVRRTPNYEIFVFLEFLVVFTVLIVFGCFTLIQIHFNRHVLCQLDLVIQGWRLLFKIDDSLERLLMAMRPEDQLKTAHKIIKKRVRDVCKRHSETLEFFKLVNNFFGPFLFYQAILTTFGICICGFQIAHGLENGRLEFLFLLLFIGSIVQIWIPCMIGSLITQKGIEVQDSCYESGWELMDTSHVISKDVLIFLRRANQPIITTAVGLAVVNLESFIAIVKTAGSYFTMLRQVNEDIYK